MFKDLRKEVFVSFVDIGRIVEHHWLKFPLMILL